MGISVIGSYNYICAWAYRLLFKIMNQSGSTYKHGHTLLDNGILYSFFDHGTSWRYTIDN